MGTPQAAVPSLERCLSDGHEIVAVYTQPDRPSGRGNKITFSPVKATALGHNLAVFQPAKIRNAEALECFRGHAADVAVVVAYGRILPEPFLSAFSKGAINVHFSLLPHYRGAAPVNWAIVNGEAETGVTTMNMDEGLDTGDILLQDRTEIGPAETSVELVSRLAISGAELLSKTLRDYDLIVPRKQDHSTSCLAPIMKREDGRIDWQMTAKQIFDRIRGFQPFPAAHTLFRGQRLTIWKASLGPAVEGNQRPGEIIGGHASELTIIAGDGHLLKIDELQPEGKRRMLSRDFINGFSPRVGEILGS